MCGVVQGKVMVRLRGVGSIAAMAAVAASTAVFTVEASAQRAVIFGDSLSDTGNLPPSPNTPTAPPYGVGPNGLYRFSSGSNWVDILYGPTSRPFAGGVPNANLSGNLDYAFGGARADNTVPAPPGVPTQLAVFAGQQGTFKPTDTVTIWAGANDLFQFFGAGLATSQGAIVGAANTASTANIGNVNQAINLGAKTILVPNLPDFGATPQFNGTAAGAQAGTLASNSYNALLSAGLPKVAGVNIIQADVAALFSVVIAKPSAYGFTNTTDKCFNGATVCAKPNTYVFFDAVHPTQAGYALVAQYFAALMNTAPAIAQTTALSDSGLRAGELATNAVFDRLSQWVSGAYALKNGPYAEILGSYGTYDITGSNVSSTQTIGGVRGGIDKKDGNSLFGGSVTLLTGEQSGGGFSNHIRTVRADLYGSVIMGSMFANLGGSIGANSYEDIERQTPFATVIARGKTAGFQGTATGEVGVLQTVGNWTIMPSARLSFIHTQIDSYSERAELLAQSFDARESDALLGGVRVRASTGVMWGKSPTTLFGELGYEDYLSYSGGAITAGLVNNTAQAVTVQPGDPNGPGFLGKIGLSSQIAPNTYIDGNYGISVHNSHGETHTGNLRIKSTF
jgi:outer membrane lipase/esterase